MKGGKLRCERNSDSEPGCIAFSCVDYEKGIYDSYKEIDCDESVEGWKEYKAPHAWGKYFDDEAKANYWYNRDTGEASWIDPDSPYYKIIGKSKGRGSKKNKKRKSKTSKRKHNRTKRNKKTKERRY